MLRELSIRNIVLIDACDLTFADGLCVLTGETGAGKSILLDALGLALGGRSEARLLRHGTASASVGARFDIATNAGAKAALAELGLEPDDEILVRRTLSSDGKTRCFINDVAVSVTGLKALGETLIEIHGQHSGGGLLDPLTHRAILDAFGGNEMLLKDTGRAYESWKTARDALDAAREAIAAAERERDYLEHMRKELSALGPLKGEEETLADSRTRMMQGEKLAQLLCDAKNELSGGKGASAMIASAQRMLARSSLGTDGRFSSIVERMDKAGEELAEAENQLERLADATEYDSGKLEQIEERLFSLRGMARKYAVPVDELAVLLGTVEEKLQAITHGRKEITALEQTLTQAAASYRERAQKLSTSRIKAAKKLEISVAEELTTLKMGATVFSIGIEPLPEDRFSPQGSDSVQFMAATNKGSALSPLHKIASGGELSRFMLAMKVALARVKSTPTLIFDEIDTGTGGAVADAIGQRLARLGESLQVLVVTHLPQVAARGAHHFRVSKQEKRGGTVTAVETLTDDARGEEVARMLAGETVTAEARQAALRLLKAAG